MSEQTIITTPSNEPANQLTSMTPMATIGQVANQVAANHIFTDYLNRKSDYTIATQYAALKRFGEYLEVTGIPGLTAVRLQTEPEAWRGLTWGLVEGFVKWQLHEGYAMATVNNRLSAIKVYAKMAAKAGVIDAQELQLIKVVTGYGRAEAKRVDERRATTRVGNKKELPVRLTSQDAHTLKDQPDTPQGRRDALLCCLLLDLGLRVGEVYGLFVENFDLEQGELRFYRPKVDMEQTHQLTGDAWRAARRYMVLDADAEGRLLLGSRKNGRLTNKPMSIRAMQNRITFLGERQLGLEGLSPHDCRHYWATDAARNGTDPFRLQEAGGWASLAMPRRYVEMAEIANKGVKLSG